MSNIVFSYHSINPKDYKDIGRGARVGRIEIRDNCGNETRAELGAERLELQPGRYIAIQECCHGGDITGWSWIVDVAPPNQNVAMVVKS